MSTIRTVAWHPQAPILATGHEDGEIIIWEGNSERIIKSLRDHNRVVNSVS
ncbi:MAG: hypothetical protein AAGA80_22995 [Cyanobacteria bacterium P01_F01_bin.143]